jgi:hypothetical protein
VDTQIRYLELVHGDLKAAGRREAKRRRRPVLRDRRPSRVLVAASVAALTVAGAIGWWVQSGGFTGTAANDAGTPSAGSTGATGATGGNDQLADRPALVAQATPAPATSADASSVVGAGPPADELSRIIRTARVSVVIPRDSFEDRFAQAADVASTNGGFVASSTTQKRSGTIAMRIPAANFEEALRGLRALGTVETQTIQGRDVTADYVDLQARLRIAKSRREVLLRLMDQAVTIEQTIRVQNALDVTQLRIEEIQGQLNVLNDRTSLATIQLDLREQGVQPAHEVEKASIPNAFERAVAGFVGVIAGIVVGLGYLLPVILLGLAAWGIVVLVRRRRTA